MSVKYVECANSKNKAICQLGIIYLFQRQFCLRGTKTCNGKYIAERGGIVDSNMKKRTDYLIIGSYACQAYSNGTYGAKVKKAIEYNKKGGNVQIMKETDFFANIK